MPAEIERLHSADAAALSDNPAVQRILNRWRNLRFLRSPADRHAEIRALQSMELLCIYRGGRYRVVQVHVNGTVSLELGDHADSACTEALLTECSTWEVKL